MDLRIIIRRLLQSRNPGDAYRSVSFRICACSVDILGWRWFQSDPDFCLLLGSLAAIELRLLLDKHPNEVNSGDLVACCSLAEKFIEFVESDDLDLSEERATVLSRCCQENAAFLAEYLVKGTEEQLVFPPQLLFPLYRVVCSFLAIGGAAILDLRLVRRCVAVLIDAAILAIEKAPDEFDPVALLLPSLPQLTHVLPNATLSLLLRYVKQKWPTSERADAVDDFVDVVAKMNGRGWLQQKDVVELAEFVE
uniref:Uncharacterized protein n=1 Tax=Plectus sambesii TaxID=2011161 RepID=A0A914V844_9BILA